MPMTYGDLGETLTGISLALSGDVMLGFGDPGSQMSTLDFMKETVMKIRENEAKTRGITLDEQFGLPEETVMHPDSEKIFKDACDKLDQHKKS